MAERVLSTAELNRAVLARQLLLERSRSGPVSAVEQVAGLQTQYAPSGYVGLWSRLEGFGRDALTDALLDGRIVQGWVMRSTIHMVSARDYWPFTEAVRAVRRQWWLRATRRPPGLDIEGAAAAVRGYLTAGPLKQAEIQQRLADEGFPREAWSGVQLWVDLVRVPPAGTWDRPRAHVYGLAPAPEAVVSEAAGRELLVARYLRAFGPASAKDVSSFCGWTVTITREVLGRLELRRFRDESGAELVDVPDAPLPRGRHTRAGPVARPVGRHPAGARPAGPDPARALPAAGVRDVDAAVGAHVPRRRPGGGHVAHGPTVGSAASRSTSCRRPCTAS